MANIGDKYVIEIGSKMTNKNGTLYGIKGFKSLVFDEDGLSRLEKKDKGFWQVGDIVKDRDNGRIGIIYRILSGSFEAVWDDGCHLMYPIGDEVAMIGNVWDMIEANGLFNEAEEDGTFDRLKALRERTTARTVEDMRGEEYGK